MTDPQSALGGILPGWFRPAFPLAVVLGTVANNAMTAYSSGLALQAVGVRIRRSRSVALDGTLGVAMTLYALLVSNFLDTVASLLQVMVALLGPSMAIYATDILLRRNRYDGRDLSDETRTGPFWYTGGVNWAGAAALIAGTAVASLCLATPLFTGPIARAVGGIDLSLPAGLLVSPSVYLLMTRFRRTWLANRSIPWSAAWATSRRLMILERVSRSRGGRRESRAETSASKRVAAWETSDRPSSVRLTSTARRSVVEGTRATSPRRSARSTRPVTLDLSSPRNRASSFMVGLRSRSMPSRRVWTIDRSCSAARRSSMPWITKES